MYFALYQKDRYYFRSCTDTGKDAGLYCDAVLIFLLQQILYVCFYVSTKAVIFVRLFSYGKVFAWLYMQFDRRKLTAGYLKLHRLLQFTRAVGLPATVATILPGQG
jgi:hypothetical protein